MGIPQWASVDVKERLKSKKSLQIIDVRQPDEFASGHIPGAKLVPLGELANRYHEIDRNTETVVVCRSGGRSSRACEMLRANGFANFHNLIGGMLAWDGDIE